ncbi:MAG: hypothetical protein V3U87_01855, partial [Methylococcaceae bacterium]
ALCFQMNEFKYPDIESCISILDKLGIDKDKLDLECQDWEYTLADERYLKSYIKLYSNDKTTKLEKRVLGCFIIQCLQDILVEGAKENYVIKILTMLSKDMEIHKYEFEYWSLLEDENYIEHEEDCWHITKLIRTFVVKA